MPLADQPRSSPEPAASWLTAFEPGDPLAREEFFGSLLFYEPGSSTDGRPVKLFKAALAFALADYSRPRDETLRGIAEPAPGFRDYPTPATLERAERDLTPRGWRPLVTADPNARRVHPRCAPSSDMLTDHSLVGDLRADLTAAQPFIRNLREKVA